MNLLINIPFSSWLGKSLEPNPLYSSLLGTLALSAWLAVLSGFPFILIFKGDFMIATLMAGSSVVVVGSGLSSMLEVQLVVLIF